MSPRTKKKSEESENVTLAGIFNHLEKTKDSHYSFNDPIDYYVSSGSLNLDLAMGGGMCPGITTFTGVAAGGKTSCALSFAANFQKQVKNRNETSSNLSLGTLCRLLTPPFKIKIDP